MTKRESNFYILTGGPGSGKTSVLDALKLKGYICVDEVARKIIREQTKIAGDATHTQNQRKYLDLMLSRSIFTYDAIPENNKPVFFDRGIPELIGYCHLIGVEVPQYLYNAVEKYRYNQKVFLFPPWHEIYTHDEERKQTWNEAVATYHRIRKSYGENAYELIEVPFSSVEERVNFILKKLL